MSNKIRITTETNVRVLTFQGLKDEYYQGVPEAWIECFGAENVDDSDTPTFDRILYLRNVNIRPTFSDAARFPLPIWHAAVVTLMGDRPVTVLLISKAELMDRLISQYPYINILTACYPKADLQNIQATLVDAKQEAEDNGVVAIFPHIILKGWLKEEWRVNYLQTKHVVEAISRANGKKGRVDFGYSMNLNQIEIQLNFVYLIINVVSSEYLWIQSDKMLARRG